MRYRILESENELKKVNLEIIKLENLIGKSVDEIEKVGLSDNPDYMTHESFMDLKALMYDRLDLQKRIEKLKELFELE